MLSIGNLRQPNIGKNPHKNPFLSVKYIAKNGENPHIKIDETPDTQEERPFYNFIIL